VKKTTWLLSIVICGLLALGGAGCKKKDTASSGSPQTLQQGMTKLRAALINAAPDVQSNLYSGVDRDIRYGQYPEALAAMDRIASNPGLNEQQKKLVNEVTELLKQAAEKQQGAAAPAQ